MANHDVQVNLDDNGNVQGSVPEQHVSTGDNLTYTLNPMRSASWKFEGYMATDPNAISSAEPSPEGKSITLTIGDGTSGEQVDVTLVYALDMTNYQGLDGNDTPQPIWKSNDPVIKFR